jgi:hypothetical protein
MKVLVSDFNCRTNLKELLFSSLTKLHTQNFEIWLPLGTSNTNSDQERLNLEQVKERNTDG